MPQLNTHFARVLTKTKPISPARLSSNTTFRFHGAADRSPHGMSRRVDPDLVSHGPHATLTKKIRGYSCFVCSFASVVLGLDASVS